jgi:hypothetical protein
LDAALSETVLHPIHLSIGVSRSESNCDGGAENASLTPSNRPFKDVVVIIVDCCVRVLTANPETVVVDAAVAAATTSTAVFDVFDLMIR